MEYIVGLVIVLAVIFTVLVIFTPQLRPLYEDVKKIANEVLELEEPKEEVEKGLRVKQVFGRIVDGLKKCSESDNKDCGCIVDDRGFVDGYTMSVENQGDNFIIELYDISGEGSGVLLKDDKIEGKIGLANNIEGDKLICDELKLRQGVNPLISFLANKKKNDAFTKYYKTEKGNICLVSVSFRGISAWHGFMDDKKTKKWFDEKPTCR